MTDAAKQEGEHPLYKAAVRFMVSQRTEGEAWENIATFVSAHKGTAKELDAAFKMTEDQIKKDFGTTAMPGAWRSAKAVARKAFKKGIALVDSVDGSVYGKTLVERTLAGGGSVPVALTKGQQAVVLTDKLITLLASVVTWDTDAQRIYVRDQLKNLSKLL